MSTAHRRPVAREGKRGLPRWERSLRIARHRGRVLEAMGLLLLGAAAQKWVPMPRWSRVLGHHAAVPDAWLGQEVVRLPAIAASPVERQVAVAVKSGVQRLPFEPTCLAQATAGQIMLRVRHSAGVVVIGLRPNPDGQDGRWDAHAWLLGRAGALTGGAAARGFTAATVFQVPQALTAAQVQLPGA
ncbi:MAG: lasso peptide biosynthesis B2 protein [Actinobacteria bacterium]|nr:MAG: lasso peptide biosynthesis B2 protein [Actinomycetota bacterium]